MEKFWGVEVKNGQSLKVSPGNGLVLRISQASLGELEGEKGKENVNLFVNVGGEKLVLGTLITNKLPQHHFDLLFDLDFELSHNWKSGSVYFYGYRSSKKLEDEVLVGEPDGEKTAPLLVNETMNAPISSQPKKQNPVKIRCNICCRSFTSEKGVEDHTRVVHDGNKVASLIGNEATKVPPTNKPNMEILKKFPCGICNRLFGCTKGLEAHTKAKHDKSKSKQDIPLNLETNGKTESMINKEKHTDAERAIASKEKESDAGTEPVKIAETCKDVNTEEDEETTFEDVISDDDNIPDTQVVTSKKRPLESVESATVTSIPRKRRQNKRKAKVNPERTDGNSAPLVGNEPTRAPPANYLDEGGRIEC